MRAADKEDELGSAKRGQGPGGKAGSRPAGCHKRDVDRPPRPRKGGGMIARTWRGWTKTEDADAYVEYLMGTGMKEYRETPGNRAAYILRRAEGGRTEFVTLTFWDSMDAIKGFAGEEVERAVFYPEDGRFLFDRETIALHYEVVEGTPSSRWPAPDPSTGIRRSRYVPP
jgi:heme-degrading monooxygenase HmoA